MRGAGCILFCGSTHLRPLRPLLRFLVQAAPQGRACTRSEGTQLRPWPIRHSSPCRAGARLPAGWPGTASGRQAALGSLAVGLLQDPPQAAEVGPQHGQRHGALEARLAHRPHPVQSVMLQMSDRRLHRRMLPATPTSHRPQGVPSARPGHRPGPRARILDPRSKLATARS